MATGESGCVVVGVHGPYGSGKSSLLNLVEQELARSAKDKSPVVVRFNPWNFSTVDQLILMFFKTLSVTLGSRDKSQAARAIGEKLDQFGELLAPIGTLVAASSAWGVILQIPVVIARILRRKQLPTPEQVKEELDRLLVSYRRRLVVIIDDIDRLEPERIRLLFRLVRLNADFKNTTYLLAFDRAVAERALTEEGLPGRAYLEKIVQVSYDLPQPEERRVAEILFEELNATVGAIEEGEGGWDSHRWANMYHAGFKRFFRTIRDVKRYVNAVRLSFAGSIRGEVNPIDFLVLEAIRVFSPDVYRLLPPRKDILTHTSGTLSERRDKDENKKRMDAVFAAVDEHAEAVKDLVMEMFPPLAEVYGNTSYPSSWQADWRRARRVCAGAVFDKYFLFTVPTGEVSERTVREALDLAGDRRGFAGFLGNLNRQDLAVRLLERLEDFTDTLPVDKVPATIGAIVDVVDELPKERRGFYDLGADAQAMRIVFRLLRRITSEDERLRTAKEAIETGRSIHGVVHFASWLQQTEEEEKRGRAPELSEDGQRQVAVAALVRIREAAADGTLQRAPHLGHTLFRWRDWGGGEEPQSYVKQLIVSDDGLLAFLSGFLEQHQSYGEGDHASRTTWVIDRSSIGQFIDVNELLGRAKQITKSLDAEEKQAIAALMTMSKEGE
jgi:predicted KAP-like P-loop ATPase